MYCLMMDVIRVLPSASLLSVLEELHTCSGAPKAIKRYFENKMSVQSTVAAKRSPTTGEEKGALASVNKDSEESGPLKCTMENQNLELETSQEKKLRSGARGGTCETLQLLPSDIKWCHSQLRQRGMPQRIHQLLRESEVVLPAYEPPPRSAELEARVQQLRAQQANREYERMTESISQLRKGHYTTIGNEYRELHQEMTKHLITGIQYLLSVVGTFYAIFMAVGLVTPDFAVRVVFGICGALVVALAEIYFIIRDDVRLESSKLKKN